MKCEHEPAKAAEVPFCHAKACVPQSVFLMNERCSSECTRRGQSRKVVELTLTERISNRQEATVKEA